MGATTTDKNVMDFNQFLLYEAEEAKANAVPQDEELTVKAVIERLLYDDMIGIFLTGKRKAKGMTGQASAPAQDEEEGEDGGEGEGGGEDYFTSMEGTTDVADLRKINDMLPHEEFSGAVIKKIRLSNIPEPYDTSSEATAEREAKKKAGTVQQVGMQWAEQNMPELVADINRLRDKANQLESASAGATDEKTVKAVKTALTNVRAKIELAYFLSYGFEYVSQQDRARMTRESSSPEMNKIIFAAKVEYMKRNHPELYKEYEQLVALKNEIKTAKPDRLAELYSEAFEIPYDRAERMVTTGTGKAKDPVGTARNRLSAKYTDQIDGKMMLVDMMMQTGEGLSPEDQAKVEKQASDIKREKDRIKQSGAEDVRKKIMALSRDEIIDEIMDAKNVEEYDAKKEYLTDPEKAVEELIRIRTAQLGFEPKKIGAVHFRSRSDSGYNDAKIELLIPVAGKKPYKKIATGSGTSRKFTYDAQTGIVTFLKPIVLPKDTTLGQNVEGRPRNLGYNVKKYLKAQPEDKPFLPGRVIDFEKISDLIVYEPDKGIPRYVTALVSKKDWEYSEEGDVVSNAPVGKRESYYTANADVESASTVTKEEVKDMLAKLSDDEFAEKYAQVYRQDVDQIKMLLNPSHEGDYEERLAALQAKYKGDEEGLKKAQAMLGRDSAQERKRMTEELMDDLSGEADKLHVGLVVYDKKGKEKTKAATSTPNYWVRFKVIVEEMQKYKEEEAQIISNKAYEESKRDEKLSGDYRFIHNSLSDLAKGKNEKATIQEYMNLTGADEETAKNEFSSKRVGVINTVLAKIYAEQFGVSEEEAENALRAGEEKFLEDLAWKIYDDGIVSLYVQTFSTPSKPITAEQARAELQRNRFEALRRLNKKVKTEKYEAPEPTPVETGFDPITKRRNISVPAGVSNKRLASWIDAMKQEGKGVFVTGKEIRKTYSEKHDVGGYTKTANELAQLYADTLGVSVNKAKARLWEGTFGDDEAIAKKYAKVQKIPFDQALEAVRANKTHVKNVIMGFNRQQMVEKIATIFDEEDMQRKQRIDYRKKYGKTSTDKKKIRSTYLAYKEAEVAKMSDDEAVDAFIDLTGEEIYDVEAKLEAGREEFNKQLVDAYMENVDVESMAEELSKDGIEVYEIPAENMARETAELLGMEYEAALASIRKNRQAIINKLERRREETADVAEEREASGKRSEIWAEQMKKRGEAEAKRSTVLTKLEDELQAMPRSELWKNYAYKFVFDEGGVPKDREAIVKRVLDERTKMLQLQFTRTDASERELVKMQREDRVRQMVYKYMKSAAGMSDEALKKFALQELKMDDDAVQEIEGGASREEILDMIKKAYKTRAEKLA